MPDNAARREGAQATIAPWPIDEEPSGRPPRRAGPAEGSADRAAAPGVVAVDRFNAETPMAAFAEPLTPTASFFVRSHFPLPPLEAGSWALAVGGAVERPLRLGLDDLAELPRRTLAVTLECAGNGRSRMTPKPPGVEWRFGAAGTARFTGVPLAAVLERAGPRPGAAVVVLNGADAGEVAPGRNEPFARALSLADARDPDVLLAWEMNGEPLTADHGRPLRAVAPGRYAVDSVKWLAEVRLQAEPFRGFYQEEHYRFRGAPGTPEGTAVGRLRVRALIGRPAGGETLAAGRPVEIGGTAWSGGGAVTSVEVSADGGATWQPAELGAAPSPHAATPWRLEWRPPAPGTYELIARATDESGAVQPLTPRTNTLGYGNNEAHRVRVVVADAAGRR